MHTSIDTVVKQSTRGAGNFRQRVVKRPLPHADTGTVQHKKILVEHCSLTVPVEVNSIQTVSFLQRQRARNALPKEARRAANGRTGGGLGTGAECWLYGCGSWILFMGIECGTGEHDLGHLVPYPGHSLQPLKATSGRQESKENTKLSLFRIDQPCQNMLHAGAMLAVGLMIIIGTSHTKPAGVYRVS